MPQAYFSRIALASMADHMHVNHVRWSCSFTSLGTKPSCKKVRPGHSGTKCTLSTIFTTLVELHDKMKRESHLKSFKHRCLTVVDCS